MYKISSFSLKEYSFCGICKTFKNKKDLINKAKETDLYKNLLEKFPDANLLDVVSKKDHNE